jgi:hypothetical protein
MTWTMHHHTHRLSTTLTLTVLAILGCGHGQLVAQDYRFQVEEMKLEVHVQPDASARLEYKIVFWNQRGAKMIDVVDIGLPHRRYDISNMSASIDGVALTDIRRSEYIDVGVEVHLGPKPIMPGERGEFHFTCTMPDMVYKDTTNADFASLQIKPTWFDANLQVGNTLLQIAVHVPPGVGPDEVIYQTEELPYSDKVLFGEGDQKHVVAIWRFEDHFLSSANPKVGVSFHRRGMKRVVQMSAIGLLIKWFEERPGLQFWSGAFLCLALAFLFIRFSGGTGWILLLFLTGWMVWVIYHRPDIHLLLWPIMLALIGLNEWYRTRRKRKYLPAMATVEGGGIKRGLTAPQAAVLLELPLKRVLALIIFGLLKKGVLRQTAADPLTVEVVEEYRVTRKARRKVASGKGIALYSYEHPVVDLLLVGSKPVKEHDFSSAIGRLIESTAARMKGFDLKATRKYYRSIVARAWKQAEAIGDVEQRTERVDRNFEWLLLDDGWDGRFSSWGRGGYHYWPVWTRVGGGGIGGGGLSLPAGTPGGAPQTSLSEVAASFTGWAENTTGQLASAIEPGKLGVDLPSSAVLDLSSVDTVTADVFDALSSSSGGGGGGGGCACAGCACACACAGGGR